MRPALIIAGLLATGAITAGPCLGEDPDAKRASIVADLTAILGPAYAAYGQAMRCTADIGQQRLFLTAQETTVDAIRLFAPAQRELIVRRHSEALDRYQAMPQPLRCDIAATEAGSFLFRIQELLTVLHGELEAQHD